MRRKKIHSKSNRKVHALQTNKNKAGATETNNPELLDLCSQCDIAALNIEMVPSDMLYRYIT